MIASSILSTGSKHSCDDEIHSLSMKLSLAALAFAEAVFAAPQPQGQSASAFVGNATSNVYPPANTQVNTAQFPNESEVGFPGKCIQQQLDLH